MQQQRGDCGQGGGPECSGQAAPPPLLALPPPCKCQYGSSNLQRRTWAISCSNFLSKSEMGTGMYKSSVRCLTRYADIPALLQQEVFPVAATGMSPILPPLARCGGFPVY